MTDGICPVCGEPYEPWGPHTCARPTEVPGQEPIFEEDE